LVQVTEKGGRGSHWAFAKSLAIVNLSCTKSCIDSKYPIACSVYHVICPKGNLDRSEIPVYDSDSVLF